MNRRAAALCIAVTGTWAIAACGVSGDGGPRDVRPEERPSDVLPTTANAPRLGTGAKVYFLGPTGPGRDAPLVAVDRSTGSDPTAVMLALLEGPTADEQADDGLRSAIPAGTMLRAAASDGQGTLKVDVSSELLTSAGDVLLDALAQIVFTGVGLQGVQRIRLLVDGETQDWPTSSGDSTRDPLTIYDFPDRIPSSQPDYPALPSPTTETATSG